MAEYSNNALQTVAVNGTLAFNENAVPCRRGLIKHREGSGSFLLRGYVPQSSCGCYAQSAEYQVIFSANIAVPEGQTVPAEGISLAIVLDGAVIPASQMIVTPAAAEQYFNVAKAINAQVWRGCCQNLTVVNTSTIPVNVQNASIVISRPDLNVTR